MDNIQPGQMLGPYRIINQVGRGGMANVYKAYQASMDRYVAIKVLPSQLAESAEFVQRFKQEARTIANLEHPHILPVFDYGESDGVAYFVMRYLDAGTLRDRMEAGRPLPLNEIDRIFTQLTDALGYAHGRGVVHRDLKPANALIDAQGNLFLTDFGIAKILESASPGLTRTDAIMGTPAYISPEQAQSRPVDQRSDIYSLGIILYEMVTGSVPFTADTPLAVVLKHISDPLPLPSVIKPDLPQPIEQIILKALAKNPNDRFATTSEFVAAWRKALGEVESQIKQRETVPPLVENRATVVHPIPELKPEPKPAPRLKTTTPAKTQTGRPFGWAIGCVAVACLLLGAAGIGALALNGQNLFPGATNTPLPTHTIPPTNTAMSLPTEAQASNSEKKVLLEDDFSSQNWGTGTDKDSYVQYSNKTLRMIVYSKNYFVWSTPNEENYENIHMEVTVNNNGTDSTTAFGFMCNQQAQTDSFYYLAITPAGEYAIAKAASGKKDVFLTNNNDWGKSNQIKVDAPSYLIGADCGNGKLALYVDGKQIATVSDASYKNGGVALFAWSGEKMSSADVSFDDFLLTALE